MQNNIRYMALGRANQPFEKVIDMIPADKIVSVQINDVQARPYAKEVLRDESMHDRVAPGCGYGDTAGFCKMLQQKVLNQMQ